MFAVLTLAELGESPEAQISITLTSSAFPFML